MASKLLIHYKMPAISSGNIKKTTIIVVFIIGLSIYASYQLLKNPTPELLIKGDVPNSNKKITLEDKNKYIYVHIAGAVRKSGLLRLKFGSRLIDIVNMAKGFQKNADLDKINLAEILKDGQKIIIPFLQAEILTNAGSEKFGNKNKIINLNAADEKLLDELPGIGPSTAKKIIEYRLKNGPFKTIEELKNVSGIGEGKFKKLKEFVKP